MEILKTPFSFGIRVAHLRPFLERFGRPHFWAPIPPAVQTRSLTNRGSRLGLLVLMATLGLQSAAAQTLRFKSGFEPGTTLNAAGEDLTGIDNSIPAGTPRDWVADLDDNARLGYFNFQIHSDTNGATATLVDDPTGSGRGKVLRYWMQTPNNIKGRVQSNLYGNAPDLNEVTSVVKVYFHPDLGVLENYDKGFAWFTLQEIWTNPSWKNDLRVSLDLARKPSAKYPNKADHKLYWHARASLNPPANTVFWIAETFGTDGGGVWISDILGQWVTLVTYFKKGEETTGKFKAKIIKGDGTIMQLFDFTGRTTHPDAASGKQTGFTHHNTFKLYSDKETLNFVRNNTQGGNGASIIYWDDWEYYEGDAYTNYGGVGTSPQAPASLTATAAAPARVDLAWPDVATESRYYIERKIGMGTYSLVATKEAGSTAHSDTTVEANTNYTYRIRAENTGGNSTYTASSAITTL
jgi:hypothetical protein